MLLAKIEIGIIYFIFIYSSYTCGHLCIRNISRDILTSFGIKYFHLIYRFWY